MKLLFNRYSTLFIIGLLPIIFLMDLSINKFNFWMDFNGLLNLKDNFFGLLSSWNNNILGNFSFVTFSSLPSYVFFKIVYVLMGLKYGTYFIFYFIIFLIVLFGFLLSNLILKNKEKALIVTPIFIFNPIVLYYTFATGTVTLLLSFAGLIITFFFLYKYILDCGNKHLFGIVFSSLLITHPFIFFFLIIIIFYFFFVNKKIKEGFLTGILIIFINSFWIIPFISSFLFKGSELFGSYTMDLISSFARSGNFSYSFIFLGRSFSFLNQLFGNYYFIYVLIYLSFWVFLIYFSLFKNKKINTKYWVIILFLLLFSVGPRGSLGTVYRYFLEHVKSFSFFRSYQNVFIVLLSLMLFYSLTLAKKNKYFLKILQVLSLLVFLSFIFLRNINFTSKSTDIPPDYFEAKKIIDNDNSNNKIFLLPLSTYDYYKWDKDQDKYFLQSFFKDKGLVFFRPTLNNKFLKDFYSHIYKSDTALDDFKKMGIKYILNRKDLNYDEKGYYQKNTFQIPGKQILVGENLDLYSIDSPNPIVQLDNSYFKTISQSKYTIHAKGLSKENTLIFLQQFNTGWNIYLNPILDNIFCNNPKFYKETRTTECSHGKQFFEINDISHFWKKPIFDDTHTIVNGYANQWTLDSEYIKQNFPKEYYKQNPDGSIDIDLVLYFRPQSYFYLGLIISGATLLGCLGYLLYDWRKRNGETLKKMIEKIKNFLAHLKKYVKTKTIKP